MGASRGVRSGSICSVWSRADGIASCLSMYEPSEGGEMRHIGCKSDKRGVYTQREGLWAGHCPDHSFCADSSQVESRQVVSGRAVPGAGAGIRVMQSQGTVAGGNDEMPTVPPLRFVSLVAKTTLGARHSMPPVLVVVRRERMASSAPPSTASLQARMALWMARASERPWAMTVTPSTPSRGAPPTSR